MTSATHKTFYFRRLAPIRQNPAPLWEHFRSIPFDLVQFLGLSMPNEEAHAQLARHMPEMLPDFDALMAGLSDLPFMGQALAMYSLRPFWSGCSVMIAQRGEHQVIVRNYDMGPDDCSGVLQYEALANGGWILGSSEGGWGYMDGINDRGLAVAITFGGRFVVQDGFSVPMLVRYLLQEAGTVTDAIGLLRRLPVAIAQNFVLLDRQGSSAVVYASPDRGVIVADGATCTTNHQEQIDAPELAAFVRTEARLAHLQGLTGKATLADFLQPPLYNTQWAKHFGTLYSVEFDPTAGYARYAWPGQTLLLTPETEETSISVMYQA